MFPEAAFGKKVGEEPVGNSLLSRKFLDAERESLRDGKSSALKPVRIITKAHMAKGISPQVAYKPLPVPYV